MKELEKDIKFSKRIIAAFLLCTYISTSSSILLVAQDKKNKQIKNQQFISATKEIIHQNDSNQNDRVAQREKINEMITVEAGGSLSLGKARIDIPAGALSKDTEISITYLVKVEDTGELLFNAIPNSGGYRFLPAGTKFRKNVIITLPYNPILNSKPQALEDLYTYFYNKKKKQWEKLERIEIDRENCVVRSLTNHFTDMINATLTLPESASPVDVNLNSIKNLEAAKPDSHLIKFNQPQASYTGDANFSFELDIPSGRRGMQPSISINFSSAGGNGIMGKNFDINYGSSITTDTRFGLPDYDNFQNNKYMLDGILLEEEKNQGRDKNPLVYYPLKQVGFEKILRYNAGTSNDYWEVINKNGTRRIFGNAENSFVGKDNKIFTWNISKIIDAHGNNVIYEYKKDSGYVYPSKIYYTGKEGKSNGRYSIEFLYDEDSRKDVRIDGRSRELVTCKWLLKSIVTKFDSKNIIRSYIFKYKQGLADENMLISLKVENSTSNENYEYTFEYEEPEYDENKRVKYFHNPQEWDNGRPLQTGKATSFGTNFNAAGGAGFGTKFADFRFTGGGNGAVTIGNSYTDDTMIDVNGDGRPDSILQIGSKLFVSLNENGRFSVPKEIRILDGKLTSKIDEEKNSSTSIGWNVYSGAGAKSVPLSLGVGYTEVHQINSSRTTCSFMDMDGDGLVDIVEAGKTTYLKNLGNLRFEKRNIYASVEVEDVVEKLDPAIAEKYRKSYYVQTPFRVWNAPYEGIINITESAKGMLDNSDPEKNVIAKTFIGKRDADKDLEMVVSSKNVTGANVKSGKNNIEIKKDENLYFITDNGKEPKNTDVSWNITTEYSQIKTFKKDLPLPLLNLNTFMSKYSEKKYSFSNDSDVTTVEVKNQFMDYLLSENFINERELFKLYNIEIERKDSQTNNFDAYIKFNNNWLNELGSEDIIRVVSLLNEEGYLIPTVYTESQFNDYLNSLDYSKDLEYQEITEEIFYNNFSKHFEYYVTENIYKLTGILTLEDMKSFFYLYPLPDSVRKSALSNYIINGITPVFDTKKLIYRNYTEKDLDSKRDLNSLGTIIYIDDYKLVNVGHGGNKNLYLDLTDNRIKSLENTDKGFLLKDTNLELIDLVNNENSLQLNYGIKRDNKSVYESIVTINLLNKSFRTPRLTKDEFKKIADDFHIEYADVNDPYWNLTDTELSTTRIRTDSFDKYLNVINLTAEQKKLFIDSLYIEKEAYKQVKKEQSSQVDSNDTETEDAYDLVYDYSYYVLKDNPDYDTAQKILDEYKILQVLSNKYSFYSLEEDEYVLKQEWRDFISYEDFLVMNPGSLSPFFINDSKKKYDDYLKKNNLLISECEKFGFGKYGKILINQVFQPEHLYTINNNVYNLICWKDFSYKENVFSVERSKWNSKEDYDTKNLNVNKTIYSYKNVINQGDTEYSQEENITISNHEIFYGGKNNWFYGFWKDSLYDTPFSEDKLLEFNKKKEGIKSEEDFKNTQKKVSNVSSEDMMVEENDDTGVHFYLPQLQLENEFVHSIQNLKNVMVPYDVDLSKSLLGTISVDSKLGVSQEDDSFVNEYYMPFIYEDIIHADRIGGVAYYNIEGLEIENPSNTNKHDRINVESPFNLPSIRMSYRDGIDRTPTAKVGIGKVTTNFSMSFNEESVSKSFNMDYSGASAGFNTSDSSSKQIIQDMNGDGIPDIVQTTGSSMKIVKGSKNDYEKKISFNEKIEIQNISKVSENHSESFVFGGSPTSKGAVETYSTVSPSGNIKNVHVVVNSSPNAISGETFSKTTSKQKVGIMDINNDGLPDFFNESEFLLNNGSNFISDKNSFTNKPSNISESKSESFGMNFSLPVGKNGNASLANANSLESGPSASIGVTYTSSSSNTKSMFMDINGDGLQDWLTKSTEGSEISVKYNTGNGFVDGCPIALPSWDEITLFHTDKFLTQADSTGFDLMQIENIPVLGSIIGTGPGKITSNLAINPFGTNAFLYANELDWNTSINIGFSSSVGASTNIPVDIIIMGVKLGTLNVTVSAGTGANASSSVNGASVKMIDMDGDGLVDHVLRVPGYKTYWKRNISGTYGQLNKINLPQGGNIQIKYIPKYGTVDSPSFKYVLSEVIVNDGCEEKTPTINHGKHSVTTSYKYENDYYDRQAKENYGFEKVTTYYSDGSYKVDKYKQKEYYAKGQLIQTYFYEENDKLLSKNTTTLFGNPYALPEVEENWTFESMSGESNYIYTCNEYEYDFTFGNCTRIIQRFDENTILEADISYDNSNVGKYIVGLPEEIIVKHEGNIVRHRSGKYNNFGELIELKQYSSLTDYSQNKLSYDEYGNILSVVDSRGASLVYEYGNSVNDVDHMFVTKIIQSGVDTDSYESYLNYDLKYQTKISETDCNGNSLIYSYDAWQRPVKIRTSYDSGNTPAVEYKYNSPSNNNWYVVTNNKISFDSNDDSIIQTIVQIDGLGRTARSAKTGFVNGKLGWNVTGAIEYDSKGRTVKEGMTDFLEGDIEYLLATPIEMSELFTRYKYDSKDRPIEIKLPDQKVQSTQFYIQDGKQCIVSIDPLNNITKQMFDSRGNITDIYKYDSENTLLTKASYKYNAISEMITAFDAVGNSVDVTYDLLGRKTALESKDSGRQEFIYDNSSNLIFETSSVLREKNAVIEYKYDGLNRLREIIYPETEPTIYTYGGANAENNAAGKIVNIVDSSGRLDYEYGNLGEVVKETRTIKTHLNTGNSKTATMKYESDYLGRMQSITYPDNEKVTYKYDAGGQIISVIGKNYNETFNYVTNILYDQYGQRTKIEYGNGVVTEYEYDPARRWLSSIKTKNKWDTEFQNITYKFDDVGNVLSYKNDCLTNSRGTYSTQQSYSYDALYQLISVHGKTENNPYGSADPDYVSVYSQDFTFDSKGLGNMQSKNSKESVSPIKIIGDDLNYNLIYNYDTNYAHRLINAGDRYYKYDSNGNIVCEKTGPFNEETELYGHVINKEGEDIYSTDYAWGLYKDSVSNNTLGYMRTYTWNEKNQLISSKDANYDVAYVYGQDGQRSNKYTNSSETIYFNKMWTLHTDSGNMITGGQSAKNIYLGDTRIVTKLNSGTRPTYQEEYSKQYFYHSDHLGSASLISDYKGDEYQRIEYTPYGETWVEHTSNGGNEFLPYKFTGKEQDEETGLYYYGARYLDPRYSIWISTDPALGEYIPAAGKATAKDSGNLPGMGGVFNHINFNLYHYAGNNPVKYVDPDGKVDSIENLGNDIYSLPSANEILTAQLCSILRSCIGAEYSHQRMPTSSKMDCSGMLVYGLDKMGYKVPSDVTVNKLAMGKYDWVVLYDSVDNDKQGESGMLNFYKFGSSKYVHVNYGVGIKYPETESQIMDASEGSTWQSGRNSQSKQNPKAKENAINKTWAPFSTNSNPDLQGTIDFSKLKRKDVEE